MQVFPKSFVWGAATASYQIEGAASADGRGASVWDMFCDKPGAVFGGHTGVVACDHYYRFIEDVELMRQMGVQAYRFSISWPRVLPEGTGAPNWQGLDFYDRLVDALCAAGITPYVTLFHWDYPLALYRRGGWLERESADWFADYAALVVRRLSDRVQHWITLNEPQCFVRFGHQEGIHAPGDKLELGQALRIGHHALLAHGKAVQAIRAHSRRPCLVGYAPVGIVKVPRTELADDVKAARESMFAVQPDSVWNNAWWLDPVVFGRYPEQGMQAYRGALPEFPDQDLKVISQPIDFLGTNIYSGSVVQAGRDGTPCEVSTPVGSPLTAIGWLVLPEALYWGPRFICERYGLPLVITENGVSCRDWVSLDHRVHDPARIDFTHKYLLELARAIEHGTPVSAYFHWSLLDNFEWAEGYKERFGLVFVDFASGRRILKDSARWYRKLIASNGALLRPEPQRQAAPAEAE